MKQGYRLVRFYTLGGKLLKGLQSFFFMYSKVCVRLGNSTSDWFPAKTELRQKCVMSPRSLNIYKGGVVREVKAKMLGRGLSPVSDDGRE